MNRLPVLQGLATSSKKSCPDMCGIERDTDKYTIRSVKGQNFYRSGTVAGKMTQEVTFTSDGGIIRVIPSLIR